MVRSNVWSTRVRVRVITGVRSNPRVRVMARFRVRVMARVRVSVRVRDR